MTDPAATTIHDLGAQYRTGRWLFATPLFDVYAGTDVGLGRTVHLRFLMPRFAREPTLADAIIAAARRAAGLLHPNLVAVYDIGSLGGRFCVVTEAPARRLAETPDGARPDGANLARDYSAGLEAAHAAGLVHGAVDESALFFTEDGVGKVADVGLFAAAVAAEPRLSPRNCDAAGDIAALHAALGRDEPAREPDPAPSPIPVARSRRRRPAPTHRMRKVAVAAVAQLVVALACVVALLVVAWNDTDPPTPGRAPSSGSDLPVEIPR